MPALPWPGGPLQGQLSNSELKAMLTKLRYKQRVGLVSTIKRAVGSFLHPVISVLVSQDGDGYPRMLESDGRGIMFATRKAGTIYTAEYKGGSGVDFVTIRPPAGEIWEIISISASTDEIGGCDWDIVLTDGVNEVAITPGYGRGTLLLDANPIPIFPSFFDITNGWMQMSLAQGETLSHDVYLIVETNGINLGKFLTTKVAYRKVSW